MGQDITETAPWKRNIAVVFQDMALFPHLSVGWNIAYGPFIRGVGRKRRRDIIEEALATVRLSGYGDRRIDTLSGGERQRVAIARALAQEPEALLLDEPFSSLDGPLRRELRETFQDIRRKSSVPWVFVTHDREEAAALGDRIALLSQGRIVETGPGRELFLKPATEFGGRFFGAGQLFPCTVEGREKGGLRIRWALGETVVPSSVFAATTPLLLFIPREAVSLETQAAEAPWVRSEARFLRSRYEGTRMALDLELPPYPGGPLLAVETGLGTLLPSPAASLSIALNTGLFHLVQSS